MDASKLTWEAGESINYARQGQVAVRDLPALARSGSGTEELLKKPVK
jgi:hypothetical protein